MARHSDPQGRFRIDYERSAIFTGIESELQKTVGQYVDWLVFDSAESERDPIYDVASVGGGRRWKRSIRVPAFGAFIYQGTSPLNERGLYNTDILRASFAADKLLQALPDLISQPDRHIRDRISYRGELFVPTTMMLRGLLQNHYTVITVDAAQVNPEENVNDEQFTQNQQEYNVVTAEDDSYVTDFTYLPPEEERSIYND